MNAEKIKAVGDKVVVVLDTREEQSRGGIYIPERAQAVQMEGVVESAGDRTEVLVEGDRVCIPKHVGTICNHDGKEKVIIEERKVLYVRR